MSSPSRKLERQKAGVSHYHQRLGGRPQPPPPGQCCPRILFCSKGNTERITRGEKTNGKYIDPNQSQNLTTWGVTRFGGSHSHRPEPVTVHWQPSSPGWGERGKALGGNMAWQPRSRPPPFVSPFFVSGLTFGLVCGSESHWAARATYLRYHQSLGVPRAALLRVADRQQAMRDRTAR